MMQIKLFNKVNIRFIKYTIKQNIGLMGFYSLLSFIVFPLLFLLINKGISDRIMLANLDTTTDFNISHNLGPLERFATNITLDSNGALIDISFNPMFLNFIFLITILTTVVVLAVLMNFLHNKKSVDMYFSMPIKKHNLYISRLYSGLVIIIIPYIINTILFFIVQSFYDILIMNKLQVLLLILGGLFFIIVVYFINCLACVMAKRTVEALLYMGILNFGALAVYFSILMILDQFLPGYHFQTSIDNTLNMSPITSFIQILTLDFNNILIVTWGLLGITSLVLSLYIITSSHKNELISQLSTNIIGSFLTKSIVIIVSGLVGSLIFSEIMLISILPIVLGYFIASLVSYIIIYVILSKGFRGILKDAKIYLSISALCIVGMVTALNGGLGYSVRVPDTDKIESVSLVSFWPPIELWPMPLAYFQNNRNTLNTYSSEEVINIIRDTHLSIVSSLDFRNSNSNQDNFTSRGIMFEYALTNGRRFSRTFHNTPLESREIILSLLYSEEFIKRNNVLFFIQPHEIIDMALVQDRHVVSNRMAHLDITESMKGQILEALKIDTLNQTPEEIIAPIYAPVSRLRINFSPDPANIAYHSLADVVGTVNNETAFIDINPTFINTLEILRELGHYEFTEIYTEDIDVVYIISQNADDIVRWSHRNEVHWAWHLRDIHSLVSILSEQKNINLDNYRNDEVFTVSELIEAGYLIEIRDREQINAIATHSFDRYLKYSDDVKNVFFLHEGRGTIINPSYIIPKSLYNNILNNNIN